jgi:hypothetical protein
MFKAKLLKTASSPQLTLAQQVYAQHKAEIDPKIFKAADYVVDNAIDLDSETADNHLFGDAIFEPWFEASPEYLSMTEESGNEDDETDYIGGVWEQVLSTNPKYKDVVAKFADIRINGY